MSAEIRIAVRTALITAFIIAAALIWKDVVMEAISTVVPKVEVLGYQFAAALFATVLLIIVVWIVLKGERLERKLERKLKLTKL